MMPYLSQLFDDFEIGNFESGIPFINFPCHRAVQIVSKDITVPFEYLVPAISWREFLDTLPFVNPASEQDDFIGQDYGAGGGAQAVAADSTGVYFTGHKTTGSFPNRYYTEMVEKRSLIDGSYLADYEGTPYLGPDAGVTGDSYSIVSTGSEIYTVGTSGVDTFLVKKLAQSNLNEDWVSSAIATGRPVGIDQDANGLYIAVLSGGGTGSVSKLDLFGNIIGSYSLPANFQPFGIKCHSGKSYIVGSDLTAAKVLEFNNTTNAITTKYTDPNSGRQYLAMAIDSSGIYISSTDDGPPFFNNSANVTKIDWTFNFVWETPLPPPTPSNSDNSYIFGIASDDVNLIAVGVNEIVNLMTFNYDYEETIYVLEPYIGGVITTHHRPLISDPAGSATSSFRGVALQNGDVYAGGQEWVGSGANVLNAQRIMQGNFPP